MGRCGFWTTASSASGNLYDGCLHKFLRDSRCAKHRKSLDPFEPDAGRIGLNRTDAAPFICPQEEPAASVLLTLPLPTQLLLGKRSLVLQVHDAADESVVLYTKVVFRGTFCLKTLAHQVGREPQSGKTFKNAGVDILCKKMR
jgi:hypothetical protein